MSSQLSLPSVHMPLYVAGCQRNIFVWRCMLCQLQVPTKGMFSGLLLDFETMVVLQDMGFVDRAENIRALQAVNGNVNAAVERLLSGL